MLLLLRNASEIPPGKGAAPADEGCVAAQAAFVGNLTSQWPSMLGQSNTIAGPGPSPTWLVLSTSDWESPVLFGICPCISRLYFTQPGWHSYRNCPSINRSCCSF